MSKILLTTPGFMGREVRVALFGKSFIFTAKSPKTGVFLNFIKTLKKQLLQFFSNFLY